MKNTIPTSSIYRKLSFLMLLLFSLNVSSQVGIGNTNPDASSALDIKSTSQGLLTPRMTTVQRTAITAPANSLLVYDTDLKSFYYYDSTALPAPGKWVKINSTSNQRDNYVLVKSVNDFPAVVGGKITLLSNTYYEINGTITLTAPIDLNDAYVSGLDANEDVLSFPGGTIFKGSTGGSIRNVTLKGAKAFDITGPGASASLLVQNTIVSGMTTSVGSISGLGLYFGNIVQFLSNANGITYSNIGNLLLSNQGWFGNNLGTYETFTGTFGLIEKVSGFSTANGTAVALDVSTAGLLVPSGVITGTVFSGTSTQYVKGYTTGSYSGYNFTNAWTVNCPGIPREEDGAATANIYYASSNVVVLNSGSIKLPVTTSPIRMFRTSTRSGSNSSNSIVYEGKKSRALNVFGSISFTAIAGMRFTFSIYKNGVQQTGTEVVYDVIDTNGRQGLSIVGTVFVNPSDYIEIYVERNTGVAPNQFLVTSYNLLVN